MYWLCFFTIPENLQLHIDHGSARFLGGKIHWMTKVSPWRTWIYTTMRRHIHHVFDIHIGIPNKIPDSHLQTWTLYPNGLVCFIQLPDKITRNSTRPHTRILMQAAIGRNTLPAMRLAPSSRQSSLRKSCSKSQSWFLLGVLLCDSQRISTL